MTMETADPRNSTDAPPLPARLPDGRWGAGNPGRPRGSKNVVARETLAAVKDLKDTALTALGENVRKGNMQAVEFVLDRILPKTRLIELDGGSPGDIVDALAEGLISPSEAKEISTALARLRELDELDELKTRMAEIENLLKDGSQ